MIFPVSPICPTPAPGDSSGKVANTEFVTRAVGSGGATGPAGPPGATGPAGPTGPTGPATGVASFNTRTGPVTLQQSDITTVGALNDVGRNLIHNPYFNIQQRGAGPWTTSGYTLDRWNVTFSLDTVTARPTNFSIVGTAGDEFAAWAMWMTVTGNAGAGSYTMLRQMIENLKRLSGKTVTISFVAYAISGTPKIGVGLRQFFGTGGSPSAFVDVNATPVTISTTATRYSVTLTLPSLSGKTLGTNNDHCTELRFWLSSGATTNAIAGGIGVQTADFLLWGVQLEVGSVMTPLEKIDPGLDLQRCQRFYQTGTFVLQAYQGGAGVNVGASYPLPVTMRAVQTTVFTPLSLVNVGTVTPTSRVDALQFTAPATATGAIQIYGTFTASADL